MAKEFMKGNEAIGEAAVRGGIRFFAGYPITPQSELPEREDDGQVTLRDTAGSGLIGRLRAADLNSMTPLEAMNLLYQLKKEADTLT